MFNLLFNKLAEADLRTVASPGLVARALTVDFMAGCSSCSTTNSFVTNAVLIERAVSC